MLSIMKGDFLVKMLMLVEYMIIIGFNIIIIVGSNIIFVCFFDGCLSFSVFWFKDDEFLNFIGIFFIMYVFDINVIGNYFCVVENLVGLIVVKLLVKIYGECVYLDFYCYIFVIEKLFY